jgi:DNA-binding NarL/FixJ family response regulator
MDRELVDELIGRAPPRSPLDELTKREREVLALMAEGHSNQSIGASLGVESKTVEGHITTSFSKLGLEPQVPAHRRVLAVLTFLRAGSTAMDR